MINYGAINKEVSSLIPPNTKTLLDIGCGDGSFGGYLKQRHAIAVDGITFSPHEYDEAVKELNSVTLADINTFPFHQFGKIYDCIVCSHVLEHLYKPHKVVEQLIPLLATNGTIIIAIPNILFFKQRVQFLMGKFRYDKQGGLMDETHYRFFDWFTVEQLINYPELKLEKKYATGFFPQPVLRKLSPGFASGMDRFMAGLFPGLFGVQFLIVAKKFR